MNHLKIRIFQNYHYPHPFSPGLKNSAFELSESTSDPLYTTYHTEVVWALDDLHSIVCIIIDELQFLLAIRVNHWHLGSVFTIGTQCLFMNGNSVHYVSNSSRIFVSSSISAEDKMFFFSGVRKSCSGPEFANRIDEWQREVMPGVCAVSDTTLCLLSLSGLFEPPCLLCHQEGEKGNKGFCRFIDWRKTVAVIRVWVSFWWNEMTYQLQATIGF